MNLKCIMIGERSHKGLKYMIPFLWQWEKGKARDIENKWMVAGTELGKGLSTKGDGKSFGDGVLYLDCSDCNMTVYLC
jgi:hypothetical protein